ncbi:MAG: decaprenyl-phosphate phosphoribosyltransferase [Deltaproteobacteria bacterium]|nr:decaprenyl-phosphate phosphoribosyltransferase [Deltaproteobacteria bacterium]
MKTAYHILLCLRPNQWIKNGFILAPLVFAHRIFHYPSLLKGLAAFAIFCLLAGAVYMINDLFDLENDRRHPLKRKRPLAAGLVSIKVAGVTAAVLLLASFLWGGRLGLPFLLILFIYLLIQLLYNYRLKEAVILDIFCISAGFFLRVIAGAVAIEAAVSYWLIICTILLAMFLALAKRRHEIVILGRRETETEDFQKGLSKYSPYLLDQMMTVVSAASLLSYMLYCISPETVKKFGSDHMIYSFPFVLFGIFRYLFLIQKNDKVGAPEKALMTDWPLLLNVILWGLICIMIIYGVI